MKFGGTSVANADAMLRAVHILRAHRLQGHEIVVVTSALPGVTDELINISKDAVDGNLEMINKFLEKHLELHHQTARNCIRDSEILRTVINQLTETLRELGEILRSVAHLRELTPRSKDFILSFGERLSAPIFCGAANDLGLKADWFTGGDAGITTDENFGEAKPLLNVTTQRVKTKLEPLLKAGRLPVIAGYGACSPHGLTTTLGRGGSDYTATLIGASLDADEVSIWKDVEGLMTADPKIEPKARVIHQISYDEASEMAYFGAKAIHPRALDPVVAKQIPVRVRSSLHEEDEGTLITSGPTVRSESIVKAVTLVNDVALISVRGAGMVGLPGVAAKVFKLLGDAGINILMISQSSSEAGISFVAGRDKLQAATNALEVGLLGTELVENISTENDVSVVAAVGAGMKGAPGVAARVFKAVAERKINVRMIAQGSSELNISFVVAEQDGREAVRAIHQEFELGKVQG
jgi:aspartate kinase